MSHSLDNSTSEYSNNKNTNENNESIYNSGKFISHLRQVVNIAASAIAGYIASTFNLSYTSVSVVQNIISDIVIDSVNNYNQYMQNFNIHDLFNFNFGSFNIYVNIFLFVLSCIIIYYYYKLIKYIFNSLFKLFMNTYTYNRIKIWYHKYILKNYYMKINTISDVEIILNYLIKNNIYIDPSLSDLKLFEELNSANIYSINKYADNLGSEIKKINSLPVPDINRRLYIKDPNFNVHGYIIISKKRRDFKIPEKKTVRKEHGKEETMDYDKDIQHQYPYLYISININVHEYINKIKGFGDREFITYNINNIRQSAKTELLNESNKIAVTHVKNSDSYIDNVKYNLKENETKFIKTFFNEYRDELWNNIRTIIFEPEKILKMGQYPQLTLCLYGPPGCGKSSFAYRIARAIGANIISVRLSELDKYTAENIFNGNFSFHDTINGTKVDMNKIQTNINVFVLDEFDNDIVQIYNTDMEIKKHEEEEASFLNEIEEINKTAAKENRSLNHKERERIQELRNFISSLADAKYTDKLRIDDLLTLIQGASSCDGRIIIATTNKYKKIFNMNNRLFRAGRFKPIYFGYPTRSILNEITTKYYGHEIKDGDIEFINVNGKDTFRLPCSNILEVVVNIEISFNGTNTEKYNEFIRRIKIEQERNQSIINKYIEYEIDYSYYEDINIDPYSIFDINKIKLTSNVKDSTIEDSTIE